MPQYSTKEHGIRSPRTIPRINPRLAGLRLASSRGTRLLPPGEVLQVQRIALHVVPSRELVKRGDDPAYGLEPSRGWNQSQPSLEVGLIS